MQDFSLITPIHTPSKYSNPSHITDWKKYVGIEGDHI